MCFVVQNHLGKGARCAPPLHPPGCGSVRALNPFQSQKIVSPINHSQGLEKCLSTCTEPCTNVWPSDHQSGERSCSPRYPHDHFMETISSRPGRELSRYPVLGTIPSSRSLRAPCIPDQPCADWMPPSCRRWITIRGLSPPPEPSPCGYLDIWGESVMHTTTTAASVGIKNGVV